MAMTASSPRARKGWRAALALAAALALPLPGAAQTAPSAPTPPPVRPGLLPPLTPAEIDNTLAIGGADIAAR